MWGARKGGPGRGARTQLIALRILWTNSLTRRKFQKTICVVIFLRKWSMETNRRSSRANTTATRLLCSYVFVLDYTTNWRRVITILLQKYLVYSLHLPYQKLICLEEMSLMECYMKFLNQSWRSLNSIKSTTTGSEWSPWNLTLVTTLVIKCCTYLRTCWIYSWSFQYGCALRRV